MTDEELVERVQALVEQHADGIYRACERGTKCPDDLARAIIPIVQADQRERDAAIALSAATCGGVGERGFERIIGQDIATAIRKGAE